MKKLMTLMLGLSLALGSVAVAFGQDEPKKEEKEKKGGKKKKGEDKKGDEQKKEFR
jgi:hypothetical protein